jgi:hypothetical protein
LLPEADLGENLTTLLVQQFGPPDRFFFDQTASLRNLALLLDDCHLLAGRYAELSLSDNSYQTFNAWLSRLITHLTDLSSGRLWVIGTVRDEPSLFARINLSEAPWTQFPVRRLEPLSIDLIPPTVVAVSDSFDVSVAGEAMTRFVERCDGTFMSIVAFFQRMSRNKTRHVTVSDAEQFVGSYPGIWRTDYESFIRPTAAFRAIFEALSLLRQVAVLPVEELVVLIASALDTELDLDDIAASIEKLGAWIGQEELVLDHGPQSDGRAITILRCADAYLQDLASLESPGSAFHSLEGCSLHTFIPALEADSDQPFLTKSITR